MKAAGLAVAAVLAIPAAAQDADPPPIVVEVEKRQSEEALTGLARDLAGNPRADRPLARFEKPLCLMVAAGNPELGREIAARIIENAKAAKVRVRSSGCSPNALVTFSDDAQAQLREIRKSGRRLFAGLSAREIDAAMGARDPVYVFQASRETSATGQEIVASPEAAGPNGMPGPENRVFSMSRIKREVREDMLAALVVIDNGAAAGLSPIQIADYTSLRLLAGKSFEIGQLLERAVEAGRGHLEPAVIEPFHFQRVLQLARHALAVLHVHELRLRGRRAIGGRAPGQVDRDAQQAAGRTLHVHQVKTQSGDGLCDGVLPGHLVRLLPCVGGCEKRSAKKNGPVVTRPFGREARIVTPANA